MGLVGTRRCRGRRRGLAPLEFVLWLPVLLSVMALMVVFGVMGAWRVRGEIVARDAVWRARWPRTGASEPRPDTRIWPADASVALVRAPRFSKLDIAAIDRPVVRGPLPNGFVVHDTLLPTKGAVEGQSEIVREYPLLPKLGPYRSGTIRHPLLADHWRIAEMGKPNISRRILILYKLPVTKQSLPKAFYYSVKSITSMPNRAALDVLDADDELGILTSRYVDFHPVVPQMCSLDRDEVHRRRVEPLIDTRQRGRIRLGRISRLPRTMTNYFLSVFRSRVALLQSEIEQGPSAAAQAEIAALKPKIQQLEAYQMRLGEIEEQLREQADSVIP
jgi:hypothetical protein